MLKTGTIAAIVFGLLAGTSGFLLMGYIYAPFCCAPPYQALGLFGMVFGAIGGFLIFPHGDDTRFLHSHPLIQYLSLVVFVSGIVILSIAVLIGGIGFVWLSYGMGDRVVLAVFEGTPFLILAILFFLATFGLVRLRLWAWWLALIGSLGALTYGIYRYYLSPLALSGGGAPWVSSTPGGWLTMVFGIVVVAHSFGLFPFFRRYATETLSAGASYFRGERTVNQNTGIVVDCMVFGSVEGFAGLWLYLSNQPHTILGLMGLVLMLLGGAFSVAGLVIWVVARSTRPMPPERGPADRPPPG